MQKPAQNKSGRPYIIFSNYYRVSPEVNAVLYLRVICRVLIKQFDFTFRITVKESENRAQRKRVDPLVLLGQRRAC